MPGLKRFIPNIRLGKDRGGGIYPPPPPSPVEHEKSALKRANARLHKRNKSSVNIRDGLGIVHNSLPIRDGMRFSRQNSFEPGESVKDFDAVSPVASTIESAQSPPGFNSVFFSSTAGHPNGSSGKLAEPASGDVLDDERILGRYSLEVHPSNLATAAAKSALERRAHRHSELAYKFAKPYERPEAERKAKSWTDLSQSRPTLKVVNGAPEPESGSEEDQAAGGVRVEEDSIQESKIKVPAIRDINWNEISEEEVRRIARVYDRPVSLAADTASPADSAIALSRGNSGRRYSGKGKGRQEESQAPSHKTSGALDAWLASQVDINDDLQRSIASYNEIRHATSNEEAASDSGLDLSDDQSLYTIAPEALADALDFERQQSEEQERLLANAWEIESLRYLEQLELREKREREAQIIEQERLRKELEEFERQLEQELLEQALREIEEEERRLEEARLARQRECCVCGDSQDPENFHDKPPTKGCEHPSSTCKECLQAWMASEFDTKGCDGIKCPECTQTLEYNEVQEVASAETFEAYDKLATRNALGSLDEFAWCLAVGCGSGQLNIENNHFMECVSCKYKQCLKHKVPWHQSETCEQYEYRTSGQKKRDEEKREEAMLNKLSKKCPGLNCGWRIEKIDGCEHMTCKKCKFEFCWICLASHTEIKRIGNTAHDPTCKFHSTNLDLAWPFNMH